MTYVESTEINIAAKVITIKAPMIMLLVHTNLFYTWKVYGSITQIQLSMKFILQTMWTDRTLIK